MKIRPLGNRVLAKSIKEEERKTAGGIVLPESAKSDKVVRAKVIAVGSDEKIEVKKGDEIIVSSFAGTEFKLDEEDLLLVKATDILAVIK
ncbi:co-chaperone GroES [Candidatus Bipolaricaulota bacterium]|nr:co-chaperone GroES [Candidatus Bipolaricaulota bacterium]